MKRYAVYASWAIVFTLVVLVAVVVQAQSNHSATASWSAVSTTGISGYKVYRAPCNGTITNNVCSAEGALAEIASVGPTVNSHTDSNVVAGGKYVYALTSYCPAAGCSAATFGESNMSAHVAVQVPFDSPGVPSTLTVTAR